MIETVTSCCRPGLDFQVRTVALLLAMLCIAGMPDARAEADDPTRPPGSIGTPAMAGMAEESAPDGLQSVIVSKTRRAAIIGGKTVELGGKYGAAKLVEVNEGSVVLRGPQGRQVLKLFPDVRMTRRDEAMRAGQPAPKSVKTVSRQAKPVVYKEKK